MAAIGTRLKFLGRKFLPQKFVMFLNTIRRAFLGIPVLIPFNSTYNEDGLVCNKNISFVHEEKFEMAYKNAVSKKLYVDPNIRWRCHVVCWAGSMALRLKGDFVECGVNKGFFSHIVMEYLGFNSESPNFYLVDTYHGFDDRYLAQNERFRLQQYAECIKSNKSWKLGIYEPCHDFVVKAFSDFETAIIIKGSIPDVLPEIKTERVAYLSIDMNCVVPEIAAIEYFWPKLLQGGVVVLDDYGWPGHEEQKIAMDEFANRVESSILSLPTGQGLLIKI